MRAGPHGRARLSRLSGLISRTSLIELELQGYNQSANIDDVKTRHIYLLAREKRALLPGRFWGEECALSWRSSVADRPCDRSLG